MNLYLVALVVVVNVAIFTYFDSARLRDRFHIGVGPRDVPPHAWASLVLLFLPLALPYYLAARGQAASGASREGPPPEFTARDLNVWGYVSSIGFLALAVYLGLIGKLAWAGLSGLAMVAGLFGGRKAQHVQGGKQGFDLGRAAWDMSGFRPVSGGDSDDDDEVVEGYGGYIPPIADRSGNVRSEPEGSAQQDAPSGPARGAADGVNVFAPPPKAPPPPSPVPPPAAPLPAAPPRPAPSPPAPIRADAAPAVGRVASEDDDVWDPVRADEEAQRASNPGAELPPPPPPPPPPPRADTGSGPLRLAEELPPGVVDDDESATIDEDLAPFELAPDEEDEVEDLGSGEDPALDDDLELLPPLPPFAAGGSVSVRSPPLSQAPARPAVSSPLPLSLSVSSAPRSAGSAPVPGVQPPAGFAGAARSSSGPPIVMWFVGLGALLFLAWWLSRSDDGTDGSPDAPVADTRVAGDRAGGAAAVDGRSSKVRDRASAAEDAMRRQMNSWIATYDAVMRPMAILVEEIDSGRLRSDSCLELQSETESANSQLKQAPDAEVEMLMRPAFEAFLSAGRVCAFGDETLWSVHVLQAKDHTHETQLLLDERYRYVGPYELEQEEALGHTRSTDTISGRYLAGELERETPPTDPSIAH